MDNNELRILAKRDQMMQDMKKFASHFISLGEVINGLEEPMTIEPGSEIHILFRMCFSLIAADLYLADVESEIEDGI